MIAVEILRTTEEGFTMIELNPEELKKVEEATLKTSSSANHRLWDFG